MNISDNVMKHALRNVYFISGTACAGKTTMAHMLAEKHGIYLYEMDECYEEHRAIATPEYQPDTCYHMTNFHEQWMRPVEEQARWNMSSLAEQADMVLMDLVRIAADKPVVADVLFAPLYTPATVDYNHLIFLTVDKSQIRPTYFNRPEKRGFYEFVRKQPLADVYFENIFSGLELTNELEKRGMKASGLRMFERTPDMPREYVLGEIERHFGLADK